MSCSVPFSAILLTLEKQEVYCISRDSAMHKSHVCSKGWFIRYNFVTCDKLATGLHDVRNIFTDDVPKSRTIPLPLKVFIVSDIEQDFFLHFTAKLSSLCHLPKVLNALLLHSTTNQRRQLCPPFWCKKHKMLTNTETFSNQLNST